MVEYLGVYVYGNIIQETTLYFKVNNKYYGLTSLLVLSSGISFSTELKQFTFYEFVLDNRYFIDKKENKTLYNNIINYYLSINLPIKYNNGDFNIKNYILNDVRKNKIIKLLGL